MNRTAIAPASAPFVASRLKLTHEGATRLLNAAVAKATEMGQPQCVAIVDEGGNLLAFIRMDGAKVLSVRSATRKAMSAASGRVPTGDTPAELANRLALATDGLVTNLKGGLPIIVGGEVIGGIGVGSGTGDQDREVANHALAQLPGATVFE
jgi:glc operon protein GlcG